MKRLSILALAAGLVSSAALAQSGPPPTPTPAEQTTRSSSAAGTELLTGTVWAYSPGQSITIKTGDGKEHQMALQPDVRVDGSVVEGKLASLMWATDNAGKPRVMSITAAPGSAMDLERASRQSYATPRANPSPASKPPRVTATPGPRPDRVPSPGPSPRPTPAVSP